VGKIGIRDHILLKQGILDDSEDDLMRQHPIKGAEILSRISHLTEVVSAVRHHHEDYTGTGYPDGLKGEAIPLFSRIIRIVDSWDAMTMDRPYRKGIPKEIARQLILEKSGIFFDPMIVTLFQQEILMADGETH
jgi:HD-GYP domain-containing protein (c-di-GMP phosphodiesterase class II)